jgi:hypothetical protein
MEYKSDLPVDCLPFGSSPEEIMFEVEAAHDPPDTSSCFAGVHLAITNLFMPFIEPGINAPPDGFPLFPECPCARPPENAIALPAYNPRVGLPTLASLLPSEFTTDTFTDLLLFFTFSSISAFDWDCLGESVFCAAMLSLFAGQSADCLPLAVACLHRVFSPGRSEGPPESIVSMRVPVATAAVPFFADVARDDDCRRDFIDLVTDLMVFIADDEQLSRAVTSCFVGSSILDFIRQTEVIRLPAVWDMLRAWWGCADQDVADAIAECLHDAIVPQLAVIPPEDAVHVPTNLFGMMSDACREYPQLCTAVNDVHFPSLIRAYVVASTDQDGVFASLAFLEILMPFMEDLAWIDAMWVDYVANQSSESDDVVFRFGIQAVLRSDEISDDWWEFAQPDVDDVLSKKIFCISCFAHWIACAAATPEQVDLPPLPPADVFIPILTDLLCLDNLDAGLESDVRSLLLAYLDSNVDQIDQYLADMLQDGCLGEALRSMIEDDFCDMASAVCAVLMGTNQGNLVETETPQ